MGSLDALLDVQEIDTKLDQLHHRHANLPERQAVVDAKQAQAGAGAAVEATFAELHEVQSAQKHAEDEASTVEEKAKEVDRTLYGGTIKAAKELEAYQADLAMLKARQAEFEEVAIEKMELAEPLEARLGAQRDAAAAAEKSVADAEAALLVAVAEVDAEIAEVESGRAAAAEPLEAEVLEQYEGLRRGLGGVGAARLSGSSCEGCHLEIPSAELETVRRAPQDAVVNCPDCGRILIR
ncbi:MAG: zinc ribbon domain-containing protein [Microthrixaceae bacterium]